MSVAPLRTPFLTATRLYHRLRADDTGVMVTSEDWDTMVVLDACRYDMFERLHDLPGSLSARRSRGSATDEFVDANFPDATYHDIVYVTANPRVNICFDGDFHAIVDVWADAWDDKLGTVPPNAIADATLRAQSEYPNKRIISHFVQPHAPFIGEFARSNLPTHSTMSNHRPDVDAYETTSRDNIWAMLRAGDVDRDVVLKAYDENLELTLPHVKRIVEGESGKTVVTSDHGNLIGERLPPFMRRMYGHPAGLHAAPLVTVPWLEVTSDTRRDIVTDPPERHVETGVSADVSKKLKDLGYV